ncbi:MAG: peptidase M4 family protein, partial [Myxococcaceae bacterium]
MTHILRNVVLGSVLLLATACTTGQMDLGGDTSNERDDVGSIPGDVEYALKALPSAEVTAIHKGGIPAFVHGNLGSATIGSDESLTVALSKLAPVFRLKDGNLVKGRVSSDELGNTHVKYQQMKDGLPVVGGELIVHLDKTGMLYAANSTARDGVPVSATPDFDAVYALGAAKALPGYESFSFTQPELKYVFSSTDNALHLAYSITGTGVRDGMPARDVLFIDAHSGAVADLHPQVHTALSRKVYSSNSTTTLPGTLKISEGGSST